MVRLFSIQLNTVKMRNIIAYLFIVSAAATAVHEDNQRIIGGTQTSIFTYPSTVALLFGQNNVYRQACGGCILNTRSVLTAAHCPFGYAATRWRIRMGSTSSISGGTIHTLQRFTTHPNYNRFTFNNDIAIMRTAAAITYTSAIRPARIAGANYNLADNQAVWAVGWGTTFSTGSVFTTNLRHVQISSVNQATCRNNYAAVGRTITANMLCAGRINGGGRTQCRGDDGSPLYHNGIVVGVYSFSQGCGVARHPGINTRVSRYATWIANNS